MSLKALFVKTTCAIFMYDTSLKYLFLTDTVIYNTLTTTLLFIVQSILQGESVIDSGHINHIFMLFGLEKVL